MSIINDALNKAGQNQPIQPGKPQATPDIGRPIHPSLTEAASKRKKKFNWGPVFVILVLTLITGPLVAPIFSSPYRSSAAPFIGPSYQESLASQNRQAQFAIEETAIMPQSAGSMKSSNYSAITRAATGQNFLMSGIVYSSPDSYCLINGEVVKVGEKINGATLVAVTPEKATLNYEGRTIELWVSR